MRSKKKARRRLVKTVMKWARRDSFESAEIKRRIRNRMAVM